MYDAFFAYAREREAILQRRKYGQPRPWTTDTILAQYRFCNIYREDDATTQWFRTWVRQRYDGTPEVLLATVLFRWFNRITTGDAIFRQLGDFTPDGNGSIRTAFEQFLLDGRTTSIKDTVLKSCPQGPYVTGAYIIKTPDGMKKMDGVLWCVDQFNTRENVANFTTPAHQTLGWRKYAEYMLSCPGMITLEQVWDWLRKFPYLGDFMAYEIVTDLRHTQLLSRAPDIRTWANPGPGAMRGLNRIHGRDLRYSQSKYVFVCEMRAALAAADASSVWPSRTGQELEMRDIEHTLCEFDKYERARLGQGRPRGTYK